MASQGPRRQTGNADPGQWLDSLLFSVDSRRREEEEAEFEVTLSQRVGTERRAATGIAGGLLLVTRRSHLS